MDVQKMVHDYVNDVQKPNYDGFVVIGAGLPRTGTMSMRAALGQLLNGACYHMMSCAGGTKVDWDFWNKALEEELEDHEWLDFLERRGFRAGVDFPISLFYKELMKAYPDAKVVLTVRNPETWQASIRNTLCRMIDLHSDFAVRLFSKIMGSWYVLDTVTKITDRVVQPMGKSIVTAANEGPESGAKFFNDWVEEVKKAVPKERLLVYEVKQGWKPLCEFLDLPIPEGDFPRVNDTKQMIGLQNQLWYTAYFAIYGLPIICGTLGYFLINYMFP